MEESIGLGFDSHRGGLITGIASTSFVSASARESNGNITGVENAFRHPDANASFVSNREGGAEDDGSSSCRSYNIMQQQQYIQTQQHQYIQPQQIQPSVPHPQPAVISQSQMFPSQPLPSHSHTHHIQPQPQLQHHRPAMTAPKSSLPPAPSNFTLPTQYQYFPPPHQMQQPPPVPNPYFNSTTATANPQHSVPSFQPPLGLPPVAPPSFPLPVPPPNNVVPQVPTPLSVIGVPHSLPPPMAPSISAQNSAQHVHVQTLQQQLQHQLQQQQQRQQSDSLEKAEKARAIAMRLHQESTKEGIIDDTTIDKNINYSQKRQEHFQKEKRKLQSFRLKNLEYVMKHEEKELRRHVDCMNQMTAYEEKQQLQLQLQQQQQRQRQLQLEQKKQQREQSGVLNDSGGGIGTKDQRRAERMRKRQHLEHVSHPSKRDVNGNSSNKRGMRTSLYLTNLPINGSTTERTLQSLFCMYGRLDRVTMYRHRSTGELKGDGLIVFGRDAVEEYQTKNGGQDNVDLVESVCTQMNGAELPRGTAIGVQPADTDYKKKSNSGGQQQTQQSVLDGNHSTEVVNNVPQNECKLQSTTVANAATTSGCSKEGLEDEKAEGDDDDLDDFFASL